MQVDFTQGYNPAGAENAKFVTINSSTITGLPSTSEGRTAVLTYNIGTDTGSIIISGGLPNTTSQQLITLTTNSSALVAFAPAVTLMEISNRSSGSLYLSYNSVATFATLTAVGIEITQGSFYSINRTTTSMILGSHAGGNAVVFGHYKA